MSARSRARVVGLVGLVALVVALFAAARTSEARLHPYYVIRTATYGEISPRVLFVLDTSGSMGWKANTANVVCNWGECESPASYGTENESRISAARRAIQSVVTAASDRADFALMTFEQLAPRSGGAAPEDCGSGDQKRRFTWVTSYDGGSIQHYPGYTGSWRLCQGSTVQPYPYLRWDELGVGSVIAADNQTGDVPASPLISTAEADMSAWSNSQRKVQWFPQFMGVRVHLDDTNDPDHSITYATAGDYANNDAQKDTQVRDHDFYYWPYVDGFPGYAYFSVSPTAEGANNAGVNGEDGAVNAARLYAPFYLDLSASSVPASDWGPATEADALAQLSVYTSPLDQGGVDVAGGTPWASVVGTAPASPPASNEQFSHTSVASYLAFVRDNVSADACAPSYVVLLTDGVPSGGEGGATLYERLAALRRDLGVKTYVVGFMQGAGELNDMACAAAGACDGACSSPCDDSPSYQWDTCADVDDPTNSCAFVVTSTDELQVALTSILDRTSEIEVLTGPGSTMNEYGVGAGGDAGEGQAVQTHLQAYTEYPSWKGHVVRSLCTDVDAGGNPLPQCVLPSPEFSAQEAEETFGPCPQSRVWDAGECLQQTAWTERRLFTNDANNELVPIAEPDGSASAAFQAELESLGLLTSADHQAEADAIVAFVLGRDAPDGWKLPGLANSVPVVVRRVPPYKTENVPEVAIKDPHCGGRLFTELSAGSLPMSLREFAMDGNETTDSPTEHHEYQEAVLIGDDMGVLHAFQLDSGNELWGYLPRAALTAAVAEAAIGAAAMGQPADIDEHIYGIAATINHGFAYLAADDRWAHLGIFGFGEGGREYYALDLSHMSPESPDGPFDVLWSTEDPLLKADYDAYNGETWSRPALTYRMVNDDALSVEPEAFVVFGSGYPVDDPAPTGQGRTLVLANATTGAIVESVQLPDVVDPVYEPSFGAVVDPAVGSHCLSRYWGESQETYIADPAGRLFRWDLGDDTAHEADSGGPWGTIATAVTRFTACEGSGDECIVGVSNRGDPFLLPPAVSASNRIDDFTSFGASIIDETDQFIVALASGSINDDTLDPSIDGNTFHSSLYLLVDDHRSGDKGLGFNIPAGAPKFSTDATIGTFVGTEPGYFRIAVSDIERIREVTPYPGATPFIETRTFSRATRPARAPRIFVTGVVDQTTNEVIDGLEVYYIEFSLFEPGSFACDPRFYDSTTQTWHPDLGSTYQLTFRVTSELGSGFNFTTGTTSTTADFGAGFERGLTLESVEQVTPDNCPGGNCGSTPGTGAPPSCDANAGGGAAPTAQGFAVTTATSQVPGFSPVE